MVASFFASSAGDITVNNNGALGKSVASTTQSGARGELRSFPAEALWLSDFACSDLLWTHFSCVPSTHQADDPLEHPQPKVASSAFCLVDQTSVDVGRWWTVQHGPGPVVATAIHDGHELRPEVAARITLSDRDRLREEDPFTGEAVRGVSHHVLVHRSRFEFDLNRGSDNAVYQTPAESWGLKVWDGEELDAALVQRSLDLHAEYYRMLGNLFDGVAARHERFLVLDVHSYNHRRQGPDGEPTPQEEAPDINIGTFSMPREEWAWLVDPLMEAMAAFDFNGRRLDVRENIAFEGKGEQTRFIHARYPGRGCAIALEFKKFFMDEWSGTPDPEEVAAMRGLVAHVAAIAERMLAR